MNELEKLQKVQFIEFDGTIECYNEIVNKCFPCPPYLIIFLDLNYNQTNKFTGIFQVHADAICVSKVKINSRFIGGIFKKGDHIIYDTEESPK